MSLEFLRSSASPAETHAIGEALGRLVRPGDAVLLEGVLGAGKTGLVRGMAAGMGLDPGAVCSPTFVFVHEYRRRGGPGLVHVDAYRLGAEEFETLGLDSLLGGPNPAVLVVEWADRLPTGVPALAGAARVRLEPTGEDSRDLWFVLPEGWAARPGLENLRRRGPTRCPVTGLPVPADSPTYPFSSERARMADLYRWLSGSHVITREATQADLEQTE
jgi:tRNA threonylcarbamoyladenosine biosynthesis protein TsaE